MEDRPRVLLIGEPFDRTTGGGITLSNLFEGWPRDSLAAVVFSGHDIAFDVCDHYYALGSDEISWAWPLSLVRRTETPRSRPDVVPAAATTGGAEGAGSRPGIARRMFRSGIAALGVEDSLRRMHLSPGLLDWIRRFEPDLVYSQLSDLPVMTLVEEVLDATGAPFALHIMDDWPSSMYRHGVLSGLVRRDADRALDRLIQRASVRLAIGDAMASTYLERYGVPFTAIQNSVDVTARDTLAEQYRSRYAGADGAPVTVLYAGRLNRANVRSVTDVAGVVSEMASGGVPIRLCLYTGSVDDPAARAISSMPAVEVHPAVPYEHVPSLLEGADVLLMPLDFDDAAVRFAGLSMPTKIPEYMAARRPVLTYAPSGGAVAEYARSGDWSVLVDARDPGRLRGALTQLAGDPELRRTMGARARRCAELNHGAARVREQFRAALSNGARAHHS